MTQISVETVSLSRASTRLQALRRDAEHCSEQVDAIITSLDMQIRARERFDQQLRALSCELSYQSQLLGAHGRFLSFAAARYETADDEARGCTPNRHGGRNVLPSADPWAIVGELADRVKPTVEGAVSVAKATWSVAGKLAEEQLETLTHLKTLNPEWYAKLTAIKGGADLIHGVGRVATAATVAMDLNEGDYYAAAWDVATSLHWTGGVFNATVIVTRFVDQQVGVSDWIVDRVWETWFEGNPGLEKWAAEHSVGSWDARNWKWLPPVLRVT